MANYILNRTAEQISNILDGAYASDGILKSNGSGTISAQAVDSTPTASSTNLITSGAVASALNAKQDTLSNASLLATYTQTEANLADAVADKHTHSNKAILDSIPSSGTVGYVLTKTSSGTTWSAGGGGGGGASWGTISGTLSDQTDLQDALDAKASVSSVNAKADKSVAVSVTIAVADWTNQSCTKSVSGVTASNNIIVAPDPASFLAYGEAQIRATAQGSGTVTFACETVPTEAVTVNVMIVG